MDKIIKFQGISDDQLNAVIGGKKKKQSWYAAAGDAIVSFGEGFLNAW
ncbi:hypothetical protein AB3327_00365 [Lactiplantibacillus pentosus]|uniref:Plantaricin S beta protein n=2 Tax=Lactiplantibacillus TaxID=2767842 RepID=O32830_LACPN|nr:hypothetical protein [Lactiplantibacillus pentosus]CAA75396.1 plantaricin S beta protein [Lactiplantibacillus plantarum]CCC17009.1 plantaricin S beta protein [Lactiplantibacillus pentosus IG1]